MNIIHQQSRTHLLPTGKLPPAAGLLLTAAARLLSAVGSASAAEFDTSAIPAALQVPTGEVLAIPARGIGVQIYECAAAQDDPNHVTWTLKAP